MKEIYSKFDGVANKQPKHPAVIYLGTTFSYRRVKELAERFAAALLDMGIKAGDKIIIYLPNSIQWVVAWLGIQGIGAVSVPITPIYTPYDVEYIANDSGAKGIICSDTNFGYVTKVLLDTKIERVVVTNIADLLPWWKRWFGFLFDIFPKGQTQLGHHIYLLRKLLAQYKGRPLSKINELSGSELAQIMYTGGTTKYPKGVPINHNLFLVCAEEATRVTEKLFPVEENIILCAAPLFHILGQTCGLGTIFLGGTILIQPRVNIDAIFEAIYRFKVKTVIGVPALYRMMLEHVRLDQYDLSSVEYWYSAGDKLPVEIGRRWKGNFGKNIYQGYGATETCGGVSICPPDIKNPIGSVGRILPSKKIKIVEPVSQEPVKPGEPGELLVSSDHMVCSYINKPDETAECFVERDGIKWYRTGDIMQMDKEGNLYFVDRTVDTIKYKGYRISASEIESVLQDHPAVMASCVVGVPDPKVGERVKAFVVLKEDKEGISGYELIKWSRERLVSYKVPQYIEFRDMLPKSKVGKLLRREVRSEEKRRSEEN
ncbi:MAG: long-chain fatty acid--CoA ligase [Candidatus Thorarchaeota archaeon]|nr:MAG: long-chain fatty acid--CoA ligase [Candidatus Thorarchaeota archaeon]